MSGVITLIGMMLPSRGRVLNRLQANARFAPMSIVAGIRTLWYEVPSARRAKCGTASPMNEMGPQKAVVVAVSKPVTNSSICRTCPIFIPRFSA